MKRKLIVVCFMLMFILLGCVRKDHSVRVAGTDTVAARDTTVKVAETATVTTIVTSTVTPTVTPIITSTVTPTVTPIITPTVTPIVTPTATETPSQLSFHEIYREDFEGNHCQFVARGKEEVKITQSSSYEGKQCLISSNRSETWHGAKVDLSQDMTEYRKYQILAWVKYEGEIPSLRIYAKVEQNASNYLNFGSVLAVKGEWIQLTGDIEIPAATTSAEVYFESEYKATATADDLVDIYIDQVVINEVIMKQTKQELPCLYEKFSNYFSIGVAVEAYDLSSIMRSQLITTHFNSMTMGNELKPENILDYNQCSSNPDDYNLRPAVTFDRLDIGLRFAKEHNIPLRGHTLVWHSQTPRWFFTKDYSKDIDAPLASKDVMKARLEYYIKQVLEYCQETYPNVIYCWDVVNEAINVEDGEEKGYRSKDSLWYQILGPEYVELAFIYARKYADDEVKLFYNDYNCYEKAKLFAIYDLTNDLYQKGILDGVGMQSHITMTYPTMSDYEYALRKLASMGGEIQITELDINLDSNSEEDLKQLATRYKKLLSTLCYYKDQGLANISNVTVWGLSDERSWLNGTSPKYPLLFDRNLQAKKAFWGFYMDDSIPLY